MLPKHDRYDYLPIGERKDYSWPLGKRLAFYISVNVEVFAFRKGIGSDFAFLKGPQTHRNFAWRDYGNRVGIWRIFRMLDELGLPASINVNCWLYQTHGAIFERIRERGDEIVGHGRTNAEHQGGYWESDEAFLIKEATETIERHEGSRPTGWHSPGPESPVTPDLLKEAGYLYLLDWAADDQPFWMRTRSGRLLSVPYPVEVNDSYVIAHRQQSASEFADMIVDQFDQLIARCEDQPLVCPVSLHTFIAGQPFRLRRIRQALKHCREHSSAQELVWFTKPGEIAKYCYGLSPGTIPA